MRRFIVDILLGCVVFCTILIVGEKLFDQYKGQNNYSYKYEYVKDNPSIKTLLIGASLFENGVNPYLMGDSVFNFAISARGRWMGWEVLLADRLYPTMPNLKTVIFPMGVNMYYSLHYYKPSEDYVEELFFLYSKYMHVYYDRFPENILYNSALYMNRFRIKYFQDESVDSLGYIPLYGQAPKWEDDAFDADSETAILCYKENVQYLIQLAKICDNNAIRFVVVTCPCANSYINNLTERELKNLQNAVDSIAAHYPVEYYNYLEDTAFREDSLYYNSLHLNAIGADKFAIRLRENLHL